MEKNEIKNSSLKEKIGDSAISILINNKFITMDELAGITLEFGYLYRNEEQKLIGLFKMGKNENVFYFAVEGDTVKKININEDIFQETINKMNEIHHFEDEKKEEISISNEEKMDDEKESKRKELQKIIDSYKDKDIWWEDAKVNPEKLENVVTDDIIERVEKKFGHKLPSSYIELIKKHNGGRLIKNYFLKGKYSFYLDAILGIPEVERNSINLEYETEVLKEEIQEWELQSAGYNDVIVFGEDDTGHAQYIFDYSDLNENGEPKIALFDTEIDQKIVVANSFQELIENLKIQEEIDINYI